MNKIWHDNIVRNNYCTGVMESRIGGRPENQDYFGCSDTPIGLLLVVCDGMGGGPGGALAASEATKEIINDVKRAQANTSDKKIVLEAAIQKANTCLRNLQSQNSQLIGMGTTCVALLFDDDQAIAAHVGDSRIYQMRFGKKLWRTFDHSKVMELTQAVGTYTEEDARTDPNSNVITRALGIAEEISVAITVLTYEKGDRFALCTDGVWGSMPEQELIKLLNHSNSIDGTVEKTMISVQDIGLEDKNGLHDNFTLVLAETICNSKIKEEMTHKTRLTLRILSFVCILSLIANIVFIISNRLGSKNNQPSSSIVTDSIDGERVVIINDTTTSIVPKTFESETRTLEDSISSLWDTIISLRQRNRNLKVPKELVDSGKK